VLGWRTPTLAMLPADYLTNRIAPTLNAKQYLTAIWMSGYGLSTLKAGDNIYFATGNTHLGTYAAPSNLSESVVKLAPDLSAIQGYFTDPQQVQEDTSDLELGSGGVMVLPTMPGRTVTGWIRRMDQGWLTIQTRAGQSVRVETLGAEAEGNAVAAALGQAVTVTGTISLNDVLIAASVMHAKPSPAFWPADR
jgi:hypothetical protein